MSNVIFTNYVFKAKNSKSERVKGLFIKFDCILNFTTTIERIESFSFFSYHHIVLYSLLTPFLFEFLAPLKLLTFINLKTRIVNRLY